MTPVTILIVLAVLFLIWLVNCIYILNEYERGVVFRLGRLLRKPKGPGLTFIFWPLDRLFRISLRTIVLDVPPQDVITRDNVSVKVNAVVFYRVLDPSKAVVEVENYLYATSQNSQTTLRAVLGEAELDELLAEREKLNLKLQTIIDKDTDPWGIKVSRVEIKHVDLPVEMQRVMARQAEAEREKRAKVIHAEGEFQAAHQLYEASRVLMKEPVSIQLRYLQTLTEISSEGSTTVVFPVPLDLFKGILSGDFAKSLGSKPKSDEE